MHEWLGLAPVAMCAAAVALLLRAERRRSQPGVWLWKSLAAGSFLAAALIWGAPASVYGRLMLLGLALCACGDLLLVPREKPAWFVLGIFAFLAGHVAYAAAFASLPRAPLALGAAAAAVALGIWLSHAWLAPHLPAGFRWPVRVYLVAIGAMGAFALGAVGAGAPWSAGAGAVGFMLSDLSVARERFVKASFTNSAWGLPLYFGSQLLLAWSASAPPTNLVIVSIDTLRRDVLQAYGEPRPTSPAILAFANQGLVVESAVSPSPWTLPAHASLLTGLYPTRHGVSSLVLGLPAEAQTLAELLAQAGWRTAAIVNSRYLSPRYGWQRGFAELEYIPETPGETSPTAVNDRAIEWLETNASEPFFLFLHYYDVHSDYSSLPQYERELLRPYRGRANGSTQQLLRHERGEIRLGARDAQNLIDRYVAGVRQMDDGVATLLAALDARGLAERTLVIVTSDHGEEFLEHGGVLHGRTLYEEVLRVPLVLRGPGVPAGRRLPGPASLVDVVPTVLSLLGLPVPAGLDGDDLSRYFDGRIPPERSVFSEADRKVERHDSLRAVRRGDWKLVLDRFTGELALYDLAADPGERVDVSAAHPERVRELRAEIEAFMARPPVGEAPRLEELDADETEALQALGYL